MDSTQFTARVRSPDGGAAIIDMTGDINASADAALNAAYAEAARADVQHILLNFTAVSYINSTGIAMIVGLLAQARKSGRKLHTYGLSEHYQQIFKITRLSDFLNMSADETSAISEAAR